MKVIFLKDVPRVGKRHDIKEISDGYAVNFLFPRKLAEMATPKAIIELEKRKKEIVIEREVKESLLEKHLTDIKGKTIILHKKADDKGHLFSAIHERELSEELMKEHKADVGEEFIDLEKPIKELGEFEIPVMIKGKKSFFKLKVEKL